MTTPRATPATIDDYTAGFPPDVQAILRQVRLAVRRAAPDARETISYGIPTLKRNGILVHFAAFKHHIGFYPPVSGDARLVKAAAPYAGEKGNLRFPYDRPIPFALIERITRQRVKLDEAKAAAQTKPAGRRRPTSAAARSRAPKGGTR